MNMMMQEAARYRLFKERLAGLYDDIDEETLLDTLEGLTDFNDIVAATVRSALDDEALGDALKSRIDTMRARLDRLQTRARGKREACAQAMDACGLRKIIADDLTISLRTGASRLEIAEEALVPAQFWRRPDPVLDRRALSDALRSGMEVSGAGLVDGSPGIAVRVK